MVMQTSCKKGMEQMDLLQAFEIIVDKAKGSSLGENSLHTSISFTVMLRTRFQAFVESLEIKRIQSEK